MCLNPRISFRNKLAWCGALLFVLGIVSGTVKADGPAAPTPPTPPPSAPGTNSNSTSNSLQVMVITELPDHNPPFHRAYLTSGTNQFAFVIPTGMQIHTNSNRQSIRLINAEHSRLINFTLLDPTPADNQELKPETYRELALSLVPGGRVIEQFSPPVGGWIGTGFDVRWKSSANLVQITRIIFVPSSDGLLQIEATSSVDRFAELKGDLNFMVNTFSCSKDGKLDVAHMSDKL